MVSNGWQNVRVCLDGWLFAGGAMRGQGGGCALAAS